MAPQRRCCHNRACWAHGRAAAGHSVIHSRREQRYRCKRAARPSARRPGRRATGRTSRTSWSARSSALPGTGDRRRRRAGRADGGALPGGGGGALPARPRARRRGRGGGVGAGAGRRAAGAHRRRGAVAGDGAGGAEPVVAGRGGARAGRSRRVLRCVDGLASDVAQARRVFREPQRTGRRGRPRPVLPGGVCIAQVVTRYARRRVVGVARRVVQGGAALAQARLAAPQGAVGAMLNTASVERLHATFRARPAPPAGPRPSRRACGWSGPATPSAGRTAACAAGAGARTPRGASWWSRPGAPARPASQVVAGGDSCRLSRIQGCVRYYRRRGQSRGSATRRTSISGVRRDSRFTVEPRTNSCQRPCEGWPMTSWLTLRSCA